MNYLALVNSAILNCGVSGGPISTVVGATGSIGRIVSWVGDSWSELQTEHDDWDWMRSSNVLGAGASFATVAGQASYPLGTGAGTVGILADDFGKWDADSFRAYTTSVGVADEQFLDDIDFDVWRDAYMVGPMRSVQTRPVAVAVGPDQSVNVGPPSNGLYTVTADFWVAPTVMAADADIPTGLPTRFHMLIVYRTMIKYAGYESAPEVWGRATREDRRMTAQLEAARLPSISFAGAL